MQGKLYDALKFIAQIVLPAVITLWVTVATIWGLPYVEAIAGTLAAIDAFLGAVLMIDSNNYFKTRKIIEVYEDKTVDNDEGEGKNGD